MQIGLKIKEIRENSGVSRYRLSKNTGIPYTTLTDIESGKVKDIRFENLKLIAKSLKISINKLSEN